MWFYRWIINKFFPQPKIEPVRQVEITINDPIQIYSYATGTNAYGMFVYRPGSQIVVWIENPPLVLVDTETDTETEFYRISIGGALGNHLVVAKDSVDAYLK